MSTAIICALLILASPALAEPLPVPKNGQCPAAFLTSGGYCTPSPTERRQAIPKLGQCPANWIQSGNYCLSPERRER
jgi:hypothetical protein